MACVAPLIVLPLTVHEYDGVPPQPLRELEIVAAVLPPTQCDVNGVLMLIVCGLVTVTVAVLDSVEHDAHVAITL